MTIFNLATFFKELDELIALSGGLSKCKFLYYQENSLRS